MTSKEEAATLAMALPITDGRWLLKARAGGPSAPDEETDAWTGVVPFRVVAGEPEPAPWNVAAGTAVPASVVRPRRAGGAVTAVEGVEGAATDAAPVRATGIGSWPGTSSREAVRTVRDLLVDGEGTGIPHLPELPGRGPGRRRHRPGRRDARRPARRPPAERLAVRRPAGARRRAHGILPARGPRRARRGLRGLHRAAQGPGRRAVDPGGLGAPHPRRALGHGPRRQRRPGGVAGRRHPRARRRRPPARAGCRGRPPARRAVAAGGAGGLAARRRRASAGCAPSTRRSPRAALETVLAAHDGPTVVHCCHPSAPLPLLRATGAGALAVDLTAASPARWESVAATLDGGTGVYAGVLATDGSGTDTAAPGARARGARAGRAVGRRPARARRHARVRTGLTHTRGGPHRCPVGARHRAPTR